MPSSAEMKRRLEKAAVNAVQVAAQFLANRMRELVSIQCSFRGPKGEYRLATPGRQGHSRPGEPPRKETGQGASKIGMEPTATGARVGIGPLKVSGGSFNYMAMWNAAGPDRQRPWRKFTMDRYKHEFNIIFRQALWAKLGVK